MCDKLPLHRRIGSETFWLAAIRGASIARRKNCSRGGREPFIERRPLHVKSAFRPRNIESDVLSAELENRGRNRRRDIRPERSHAPCHDFQRLERRGKYLRLEHETARTDPHDRYGAKRSAKSF